MAEVVKQIPLEEEYRKKTGISAEDIRKLRQWLHTQPHLPGDLITDLDLILAFHSCERSAEVTKQVLDLHFTLRTLFTPFFKDRLADDYTLRIIEYYVLGMLEARAYDGSAIMYCRILERDPKKFILADALRACLMMLDLSQYKEGTWPGFIIVLDLEDVTLSHLTKLDVQSIQQFLYYLQEALFVRMKGVNFLNAPSFMDKLMMMLRPFLKKRLLDMITIHQVGSTTIEKFLPVEALPIDAGGQYKTFVEIKDDLLEKVKSNPDFFVEENKKRVVESQRPGKPKTISDIFGGVEGSFKKLEID